MTDSTSRDGSRRARSSWLAAAMALTVVVVVAAAIWASGDPDGLERVAQDLGFTDSGAEPGFQLLPDYTLPGLDGALSAVGAGLIGVAVVLGLMLLAGRLLARRRA